MQELKKPKLMYSCLSCGRPTNDPLQFCSIMCRSDFVILDGGLDDERDIDIDADNWADM